ncbi:MAG: AAA family ATPase [Candidatus Bathyarchaeota archaeon]|nr:AAA family ATPase [Candidatus Bathyarchaeota archaeon]
MDTPPEGNFTSSVHRAPVGVPGFDKLVEGGFPRGSVILVAGEPGTGKTTFSAKFIHEGALRYGEPGVYVTFNESKRALTNNLKRFGIDFEDFSVKSKIIVLDLSISTEIDVQSALNRIMEAVTSIGAKRLVIDSITALSIGLKSDVEKRHLIRLLYRVAQNTGCTTIITSEIPCGSNRIGNGVEEFISDGIIIMNSIYDSDGKLKRMLRIPKMRGTNHSQKLHEYVFNSKGIEIIEA